MKKIFCCTLVAVLVPSILGGVLAADEWKARHELVSHTGVLNLTEPPSPDEVFFAGPASSADTAGWMEKLKAWRKDRIRLLQYSGAQYDRPELSWTQHVFSQVQLLIWDRSFYDPEKSEYTVDRFLSETESSIGRIDAVLIWHVYPNLGVDDRNQFDLLRDLPGGIPGLRRVVEEFHARGVKVFFPFIAWDTGTNPCFAINGTDKNACLEKSARYGAPPLLSRAQTMVQLMKQVGADGINFDTLESVPAEFRQASDAIGYPLALEPQFQPRDRSLQWSTLSWNDWVTWEGKQYPFIPMVSQTKWMESRHTVSVTDRFTRDKTDSLQHAFFNGQGYATLENLWGFWYQNTAHDAEALLRFTSIERAMADYLVSADWQPHAPTLQSGVFASRFPIVSGTLWTIVNRNEYDVSGPQLSIPDRLGYHYYDLWHGREVEPQADIHAAQNVGRADGATSETMHRTVTLSFDLEGLGYGAILATSEELPSRVRELIRYMGERSQQPLSSYSRQWEPVAQKIVEITPTKPVTVAPERMIRIPEGDFDFRVRGIEVEGGNDPGVDVQYPWEGLPRRFHDHMLHIRSFYIDRTPVTNAEFKKFMDATHYRPQDTHNFLRTWEKGTYPQGWDNKPVTWVSIEDARAYAVWSGKRLPHEWEWQYAAQGDDGRLYPWGNQWNAAALPALDRGPQMRALTDTTAFSAGASKFGVLDLVGNVSQWTDEYRDAHTRAAIVRGAAAYQPQGSIWYFPQTYRLDEHQKYLLMSPGRDRAGTIGFRCVVDAP